MFLDTASLHLFATNTYEPVCVLDSQTVADLFSILHFYFVDHKPDLEVYYDSNYAGSASIYRLKFVYGCIKFGPTHFPEHSRHYIFLPVAGVIQVHEHWVRSVVRKTNETDLIDSRYSHNSNNHNNNTAKPIN